jgi:hypothetical protein
MRKQMALRYTDADALIIMSERAHSYKAAATINTQPHIIFIMRGTSNDFIFVV